MPSRRARPRVLWPDWRCSHAAACVPAGFNSDDVVKAAYYRYRMSLGVGLSKVAGKVFRIGHIGDFSEGMVLTALSVAELCLAEAGAQVRFGSGVAAAQAWFTECLVSGKSAKIAAE